MADTRQFIPLAQAQAPFFAGVDVGGTNTKLGIVDDLGRPLSWTSIKTEVAKGPDAGIERMRVAYEKVVSEAGLEPKAVRRIGLGSPGTMDIAKGILRTPGNLPGWWNFPIRDALSKACGLPVTFSNDAGAAAYGEFWVGSGRVSRSMIMFTLGTGVGGGIIVGEMSIDGENSAGSELGHMIIDYHDDGRACSCGKRGHCEAYASASAVVQRTQEVIAQHPSSSVAKRVAAGDKLSSLMIHEEAERGDKFAGEIVDETRAMYLGIGVVTALHAIDPQGVVIGGAMTFGEHDTVTGRRFLAGIKAEVAKRAFAFLAEKTIIDYASLGGDAGFIGAAGLRDAPFYNNLPEGPRSARHAARPASSMSKIDCKHIRNFSIIAHIDHGKSTLADRLLEKTGTVDKRDIREQTLDDMDLERQRGITIKARAVAMHYKLHGQTYELNLIDTPGHVDFQYEVWRSLACCEGAVLLVDAFQGVEAQTVANAYAAMENNLAIVPVLNKIDLKHARPDEVIAEMESVLAISPDDVLQCSGKTGVGTEELLAAIVERVPPPTGDPKAPLQAMVFDSHYDEFRGAITYVRIMNGTVRKGQKIRFLLAGTTHEVLELGQFVPARKSCNSLQAGQVGYLICNIKSLGQVHVGDTVSVPGDEAAEPLPGYRAPQRMVYCGLYPSDGQDFEELRDALTKLSINDPSFEFEPETSDALGFGFRCGFLGLLHMEIIQQRLEGEADLDLVQTAPNVTYEIQTTTGETLYIHNPQKVPEAGQIEEFRQPIVKVNFVLPVESIGPVMQLCTDRRGVYVRTEYLSPTRAILTFNLPLADVIYDMHDKLKSVTRGYGTMDYELIGYFPAELVKMDILVGSKRVDALSIICDRRDADRRGRAIVKKLRTEIDRHMFEIALQAAIGTRIIARETISAMRKNVTAKCYGGDISRKRKLWAKQKEGKKRMKSIGSVDIPQKAFLSVLDTSSDK